MHKQVNVRDCAEFIRAYLIDIYSECSELFKKVDLVSPLSSSSQSITSALVRIVIMQMLSEKAANTIYTRVKKVAEENGKQDWELSLEEYRQAGISQTKAETIVRFADYYRENERAVDNWRDLKEDDLIGEITKHKGLGQWTASILALSHFGKEDVFPSNDGILKKAIGLLKTNWGVELDPDKASPYRSYLAFYLWAMMDRGLLDLDKNYKITD
ncbi:MAG: DNA-3-methyladenine glycosylase [Marinifilaceae bacterium]